MTPWWNPTDGNWYGAIGGSLIGILGGCLGAAAGILVPRGKAKTFIYTSIAILSIIGLLSLAAGIIAVTAGQPYHVWYPLVLCGGIITVVIPIQFPMIRARYRQAELRRLQAEELRRA